MAESLPTALAALEGLDLHELRQSWRERGLGEPPRLRTRELLALALSYRLQCRASGSLTPTLRRRAAGLADSFQKDGNFSPEPLRALTPGSVLSRDWAGERHEVEVLAKGFRYRGQVAGSLSKIAFLITGTKWNGLLFFGLKARPEAGT